MSILCEWSQGFSSEIKEGVAKRQLNRKEDVRDQSVGIMVIMPELRAQRSEIIEVTGPREENMLGTDWGTETGRRRQLRRCGKSTHGAGSRTVRTVFQEGATLVQSVLLPNGTGFSLRTERPL